MRNVLAAILILMCVVALGAVASAENQLGIADKYTVTFSEQIRVADTLLPKGNYEIRHEMQGSDHIMVFHQLGAKKAVDFRAKCQLVPLQAKAHASEQLYAVNAANERVLHELVFKGDRAKHVF
jgi:uncharacterized protein YxeA